MGIDEKEMKSFNQFISEAFDKPYAYTTRESGSSWNAEFTTDKNDKVKVTAFQSTDRAGDQLVRVWKIDFFRNYSQDLTGEGDAFRIFSTVMKAINQFLQEKSPEYVEFRALKSDSDDQNTKQKSSRQKLYSRLVKKYASKDYKVKETTNNKQTKYFLTRKK